MAARGDGESKSGCGQTALAIVGGILVGGVCLIGIGAAIAIPAWVKFVKTSKTAETSGQLRSMFESASNYYMTERPDSIDGGEHCSLDPATTPNTPGNRKSLLLAPLPDSLTELGFTTSDLYYYQYEVVAPPSHCGIGPNQPIYTFRAYGDLDADGTLSTFELSVSSDATNQLVRDGPIRITNELE